jgi:hypothetical protein
MHYETIIPIDLSASTSNIISCFEDKPSIMEWYSIPYKRHNGWSTKSHMTLSKGAFDMIFIVCKQFKVKYK